MIRAQDSNIKHSPLEPLARIYIVTWQYENDISVVEKNNAASAILIADAVHWYRRSCYQALRWIHIWHTFTHTKRQSHTTTCSSISIKTLASSYFMDRSFKICLAITHKNKEFQGSSRKLNDFTSWIFKGSNNYCFLSLNKKEENSKKKEIKEKVFYRMSKMNCTNQHKVRRFSELINIHEQEANCKQHCCKVSLIAREGRKS